MSNLFFYKSIEVFEAKVAETKEALEELTTKKFLIVARRTAADQRVPEPVVTPPWPMKKIRRLARPDQGEELDYKSIQRPFAHQPVASQAKLSLGGPTTIA